MDQSMNKILCIGECLIDMICTDKGRALQHGEHFLRKAGGAPANVAAAIAALGGRVDLAAKVGKDPFGTHLVEVMASFGVGTTWMLRDPQRFTTFAFVSLMENGERDFYFNRGADAGLSKEELSGLSVEDYAILHFGSATAFLPGPLQEAYATLLDRAKAAGRYISFDPNYRHLLFGDDQPGFIRQSVHVIERCDFFKVSDEEALLLTGKATLEHAVEAFRARTDAVFAITLGKEGTLLCTPEKTGVVASIPVTPVDTTGAGDAFVGALLHQLSGHDRAAIRTFTYGQWERYVHHANKAGARTCEYLGAMEAFRHLSADIFK
jgi:fructokinase